MYLINDEHFELSVDWCILHQLPKISLLIDSAVGSTIDLKNVHAPGRGDLITVLAVVTRISATVIQAVKRF
jgi:hypothetical protein